MTEQAEIIMLLREIRDLLADDRREQHDAQPVHRPAPHPIPEDGGRARQTPTDPWHSPDWDDVWANGWYVGARAAEERALRAEALVRAKDETIGELMEQLDHADLVPFCMRCLMDAR